MVSQSGLIEFFVSFLDEGAILQGEDVYGRTKDGTTTRQDKKRKVPNAAPGSSGEAYPYPDPPPQVPNPAPGSSGEAYPYPDPPPQVPNAAPSSSGNGTTFSEEITPERYIFQPIRSEERRAGKEGRSRWPPYHQKKRKDEQKRQNTKH